ncbi:MAG: phosphatase PAP2 family protein [Gemmatimonadetes bacterium]|nr:phosphatase PAP2 family protein [Gemmatimonadota bacterium]MBI3568534.1 phosphatase PAP2 family protein [Gemmatimonadota bacterium]
MSYWRAYAKAPLALRATVAFLITATCLAVPALFDTAVYHAVWHKDIYNLDWARLLRLQGWLPTWWIVTLSMWLVERERDAALAKRRAWLLFASPAVAGVLCELLKLVIRRERPSVADGEWVFRPFGEHPWSTAGLATPSSHTMVAFGAATMMARLFPRARWVFYVLAAGCAATRVLDRAHYLSDVTFGALLGWAVGWGLWIEWGPKATPPAPATA